MFLSVVTRACRRPKQLERNIESVRAQTDPDWEHLLLVDHTGRHEIDPILWANRQFARYAHLVSGEYVYMLDDDGYLLSADFVRDLKRRATADPDVILVKTDTQQTDGRRYVYPEPAIWQIDWEGGVRPQEWSGTGSCVVVKGELWQEQVAHYEHAPGGDWHFVSSLIESGATFARLNTVAIRSNGRGCGVLFEKCGDDWFNEAYVQGLECFARIIDEVWGHNGKDYQE